jgi:hypothetical protein
VHSNEKQILHEVYPVNGVQDDMGVVGAGVFLGVVRIRGYSEYPVHSNEKQILHFVQDDMGVVSAGVFLGVVRSSWLLGLSRAFERKADPSLRSG